MTQPCSFCSKEGIPCGDFLQFTPDTLAVDQRVIDLTKRVDELKTELQYIKNQQASIPNFFNAIVNSRPVKYCTNLGLAALGITNE